MGALLFTTVILCDMSLLDNLLSLVAPHKCVGCECEGAALCTMCRTHCIKPFAMACFWCNALTEDARFCVKCRKRSQLTGAYAVSEYSEVVKSLLRDYKYHHFRGAAPDVAKLLIEGSSSFRQLIFGKYIVVPVPSTVKRIRKRSFDHSLLMAREFSRRTSGNLVPALRRSGSLHQVGSSRQARLSQLNNLMHVPGRYAQSVDRATILLIDDVVTTGASLEESARALKQAGAKHIFGVVLAKKKLGG